MLYELRVSLFAQEKIFDKINYNGLKKIYIEITKQKYFIIKVDIIQMFFKTLQETDTVSSL